MDNWILTNIGTDYVAMFRNAIACGVMILAIAIFLHIKRKRVKTNKDSILLGLIVITALMGLFSAYCGMVMLHA